MRHPRWLLRLMNFYPPFLGAGIRVRVIADSPLAFEARLKLRWWNRNYVGTHFGGGLYTLCDAFFMHILIEELGPGFVVWDKAATIRFRRPGRGTVRARFEISRQRIEEIRATTEREGRLEVTFPVAVTNEQGEVVAEVDKLLSVKRAVGRISL